MNFRSSIFLSTIVHLLSAGGVLFFSHASLGDLDSVKLHLSRGSIPNLRFSIPSTLGNGLPVSDQNRNAGTEEFEIEKFKNEIHFPPEALEQRLESDCTWNVEIGREGEARKVTTIRPCRYRIFESQFRKSIYRWKFQLKEGTVLTIPVSFRIETND
ncbi:LIC_10042 family TonB-like protein [Leptospira inadai]|nr:energy transducer TonB [Leptospira inadai]